MYALIEKPVSIKGKIHITFYDDNNSFFASIWVNELKEE
jgi:hypothetical protein